MEMVLAGEWNRTSDHKEMCMPLIQFFFTITTTSGSNKKVNSSTFPKYLCFVRAAYLIKHEKMHNLIAWYQLMQLCCYEL